MGDEDSAPQEVPREMKVFTLQHLSGDDAMSVLNSLFAGATTFSRVASQKTVIIANAPAQILQQIEALLKTLDAAPPTGVEPIDPVTLSQYQLASIPDSDGQPTTFEMKLFRLAHMHPVNAVNALRPLFPGSGPMLGGGRAGRYFPAPTLIAVQSQRALIARGMADDLKQIEALLKVLDVTDVEPPEGAEVAADTKTDDEKLPPNSFSMKYQLRDAKWRDVGMELKKLRKQSGVEWFRVDTNTVDNTVTVIGSSAGLQAPSGLIQKLDPHAQLVVTDNYPPKYNASGIAVEESAGDVEALRLAYAEHEAKVRNRAERGRDPARYLDGRPPQKIAEELRAAVVAAFDARQNLQRAELAALEQKLISMRRTISAREKIKPQIVDRRIEELLNPALDWDTSAKGKPSAAGDPNAEVIRSDWPVPFVHVKKATDESRDAEVVHESPITSPDELTERLYRGKTESEWRQNFNLETEPAAKIEAAAALVNLAVNEPPRTVFERIMDIEVELLQMSHADKPLEFAFESYPTHYWSIGGEERRKAFLAYHQELQRILAGLPQTLVAEQLAAAISGDSEPHAAAGTYLLNYIALTSIQADQQAARRLFEQLHAAAFQPGDIASLIALLGRMQVSTTATESELAELSQQVIETCRALREHPPESRKLAEASRDWLIGYISRPPVLTQNEDVTRALAELLMDDVVVRGRTEANLVRQEPVRTDRVPHFAGTSKLEWLRIAYGATLSSWVAVANEYLDEHVAPPYSDVDRAVYRGVLRASEVFSDGDDWPVEQTARILTDQLRAAYVDDPSQTVDTPIHELLPAKPWTILSQIVAINGEIPEFIGTATPKSKPLADRLLTLDRLLDGAVVADRVEDGRQSLNGLLAEAPVETIQRLFVAMKEDGLLQFGRHRNHPSELMNVSSALNPVMELPPSGGGFVWGEAPPPLQTIDPLLLLAILHDLQRPDDEARDRQLAAMFQIQLRDGELGDHIALLLKSPLQSRKHAARMLREMAAKTGSSKLRERLLIVDPTISGAAAAKPEAPASGTKDDAF